MPSTRGKKPVSYKEEKDDSEDIDESYDEESEDEKISKKSKKIKKAAKPKKTKADKKEKKGTPTKAKDKKKKKDESEDEKKDESEDEKKNNPLLKKPKKAATGGGQKGYSPSDYEKYQELLKDLNDWTNDQLKNALKKNDQASTGNKKELIIKVADGKVLGKIPKCPKCFGGRPRFDFKTGLYTCPGFRDDEDFKFCNKKYTKEELPRETWTD